MTTSANDPQPQHSQRATWKDLPAEVRTWVQQTLGSSVIAASSQSGGFSLGTADRLTCRSGQRAFLKAVDERLHPETARLHRQEGRVTASFPPSAPVPQLLARQEIPASDGSHWVALLLEDIEGHQPTRPWKYNELSTTFQALNAIGEIPVDVALELPRTEDDLDELAFWHRLTEGVKPEQLIHTARTSAHHTLLELLPWANAHATEYAAFVDKELMSKLAGNSYVHTDLRADNILIQPNGAATIVDWPWATVGNHQVDIALIAVDALIADPNLSLAQTLELMPAQNRLGEDLLQAAVVSLAGYYLYAALQEPSSSTHSSLAEMRAERASILLQRLANAR